MNWDASILFCLRPSTSTCNLLSIRQSGHHGMFCLDFYLLYLCLYLRVVLRFAPSPHSRTVPALIPGCDHSV